MASAVKDTPAANSPNPFDRLAVDAFVGVAYVLASIWVVFYGISHLWRDVLKLEPNAISVSLMIVAMVACAGGLIALGSRLAGQHPRAGLKAAVFTGMIGVVVAVGLASLVGTTLERVQVSAAIGIPVTAALALGLLGLLAWLYTKPGCESWLLVMEEQGWFTADAYKKSQGIRVRRGTLLGLLILAGCGVYTMLSHEVLVTGAENWEVPIPYTPKVQVVRPGDTELEPGDVKSADEIQKINEDLQQTQVRITNPGDAANLQTNQVITKEEFERIEQELKAQGKLPPTRSEPNPADVKSYPRITLLPHVMYTLPLLLTLAALWLSYRVVNVPVFADFLIATEAELNKVSWTTRRRLVQDTIVVLVTVFLLTLFLFLVDQVWAYALTKWVGVLKLPDETTQQQAGEEVPW